MPKRIFSAVLLLLISSYGSLSLAETKIKFAMLAPEGSTWHQVMRLWGQELSQKTNGRIKLKIYAGGVLGDEEDVIRKMRIGQVHAAGFTGLGLGIINPAVRVLELPMLLSSYDEADAVTKQIQPRFDAGFEAKGFVLLGWAETGFVNIFSNTPIASRKDMDGKKMWAWKGDPLVETMYREFKLVPIPLPLTDVLTSLQTRLIDAVYAPPLGAIALQWFTQTKYITDLKIADSTGGILMTKKSFAAIPAADREILLSTARKYSRILVERTRTDNEKSYKVLSDAGIKTVSVPPDEAERISATSRAVWGALVGKLYSKELLEEVISTVDKYRNKKAAGG